MNNLLNFLKKYWSIFIFVIFEIFFIFSNFEALDFDIKYKSWIENLNEILSSHLRLEPIYLIATRIINDLSPFDIVFNIRFFNEVILFLILIVTLFILQRITKHDLISNVALFFIYFSPFAFILKSSLHRNFLGFFFLIVSIYLLLCLFKNNKRNLNKIILYIFFGILILLTHRVAFLFYLLFTSAFFLLYLVNKSKKDILKFVLIIFGVCLLSLFLIQKYFINNLTNIQFENIFFKGEYVTDIFYKLLNFRLENISATIVILILLVFLLFLYKIKTNLKKQTALFIIVTFLIIFIYNSDVLFGISIDYSNRLLLFFPFLLPFIFYFLFYTLTKNKVITLFLMVLIFINYFSTYSLIILNQTNFYGDIVTKQNTFNNLEINVPDNILEEMSEVESIAGGSYYTGNAHISEENLLNYDLFYNTAWQTNQDLDKNEFHEKLNELEINYIINDSYNKKRDIYSEIIFKNKLLCNEKFFTEIFSQTYLSGIFKIFKINDRIIENPKENTNCVINEEFIGENFITELNKKVLYINKYEDLNSNLVKNNKRNVVKNDNFKYFYFIGNEDQIIFSNINYLYYKKEETLKGNLLIYGEIDPKKENIIIYSLDKQIITYLIRIFGFLVCGIAFFIYYLTKKERFKDNQINLIAILFLIFIIFLF